MFGMGMMELVVILLIVVLLFGATRLPQLGDSIGRAIRNFKRSASGENEIEVGRKEGRSGEPGALKEGSPAHDAEIVNRDHEKSK